MRGWRPIAGLAATAILVAGCNKNQLAPEAEPMFPGAEPFSPELTATLAAALTAKGPSYQARTRHKSATGAPTYTNRLILESSPYLLQHAHNPVNWYAWGPEAFAEAARLGRPIFVSIGYATCHWCHVMEEESFEDPDIARLINSRYVAIKVDREERPDVDSVYMAAVEAMGMGGGWPLNVWLTPDRKPFFGGTYFPPRAGVRGARVGFDEILTRAADQFATNRAELEAQASKVAGAIAKASERPAGTSSILAEPIIAAAAAAYLEHVDRGFGGMLGVRSKFPSALPLRFLLRFATRTGDAAAKASARQAVAITLDAMRRGGIYDQVGGGFHRYSVDPRWIVPHFEKMLYDNAQLVVVYLEAYQALLDVRYAAVASDVLAYLVREMRAPSGGFYSATDADSLTAEGEREEGAFFVWTPAEVRAALAGDDAALVIDAYGITDGGNFEGKSIPVSVADSEPASIERLLPLRNVLLAARAKRQPPLRDEKVIAEWNGLMISALARAEATLGSQFAPQPPARGAGLDFGALARQTAAFVLDKMVVSGRLRRVFMNGVAYGDATSEDYALVIAGLLDLFEASGEVRWLEGALALQKTLDQFYKSGAGAYYKTASDAEVLLVREVPDRDGAVPSANSVAAMNLLRFYELTSDTVYLDAADALLSVFADTMRRAPAEMSELLIALDLRAGVAKQIVLTGTGDGFGELDSVLRATFVPRGVVVRKPADAPEALAALVPLSEAKSAIDGKPTAFVCEESRCELPTSDPRVFAKQLAK